MAADHHDAVDGGGVQRQGRCGRRRWRIVLQQHHRLFGHLARHAVAQRLVDLAGWRGGRIVDAQADHGAQPAFYHIVQARHADRAGLHRGLEFLVQMAFHAKEPDVVIDRAGLLLIESRIDRLDGIGNRLEPVRLDLAPEAPFVLQHIGQQVFALAGFVAIDQVIGAHDVAWLAFFDADFKRQHMQFTQAAFIDDRIGGKTVGFLVVGDIVLDGGHHLFRLRAQRAGDDHIACQHRVLSRIFEGAAIAQFARQVDAAAQPFGIAQCAQFFGDMGAVFARQRRIPAGGQRNARRQWRGAIVDRRQGIAVQFELADPGR